jgi:O-antigen/teichoic acid export membrane protein
MPALVSTGTSASFTHLPVMILTAVSGRAEVAVFVAMRSLTQPLMIVIRSLDVGDKNRFRDRSNGTLAGARRLFWQLFLRYGALGVAALVVLSVAPSLLVKFAYGGKFSGHSELLIGWCLYAVLLSLSLPIQSVVYLLHRQHSYMRWNMLSALVGFLLALVLSGPFGARGAMTATVVGMGLTIATGIIAIREAVLWKTDGNLPSERPPAAQPIARARQTIFSRQIGPTSVGANSP